MHGAANSIIVHGSASEPAAGTAPMHPSSLKKAAGPENFAGEFLTHELRPGRVTMAIMGEPTIKRQNAGRTLVYQRQNAHIHVPQKRRKWRQGSKESRSSGWSNASSVSGWGAHVPTTHAQRVVCGLVGCYCLWALAVSLLLVLAAFYYRSGAINGAREKYVAAKAERVGAEAAAVLSMAIVARDAVDYAIQRKLYTSPMDYERVTATLEPVFAAVPALRAVDLAFTDREASITARRHLGGGGHGTGAGPAMLMQSNAADCKLLGRLGCLPVSVAQEQSWYELGAGLSTGEAFDWASQPGFVPMTWREGSESGSVEGDTGDEDSRAAVAWAPACSLVFRSVFPGTGGTFSLVGRVTMDVSGLRSGERLLDSARLGPGGSIAICDRGGLLLVTAVPGEQALIQSSGVVRFRYAWEAEAPWAQHLRASDFAGLGRRFTAEGFHVVVAPMRGRGMGHFYVVAAGEQEPFLDSGFSGLSAAAEVAVWLPYPVLLLLGGYVVQEQRLRRDLARVQPAPW